MISNPGAANNGCVYRKWVVIFFFVFSSPYLYDQKSIARKTVALDIIYRKGENRNRFASYGIYYYIQTRTLETEPR